MKRCQNYPILQIWEFYSLKILSPSTKEQISFEFHVLYYACKDCKYPPLPKLANLDRSTPALNSPAILRSPRVGSNLTFSGLQTTRAKMEAEVARPTQVLPSSAPTTESNAVHTLRHRLPGSDQWCWQLFHLKNLWKQVWKIFQKNKFLSLNICYVNKRH